jgi:hypothetical protein
VAFSKGENLAVCYLRTYSAACSLLTVGLTLSPAIAFADSADARSGNLATFRQQLKDQQDELDAAQRQIDAQVKQLQDQRAALQRQQDQINALKEAVVTTSPGKATRASSNGGSSAATVTAISDTKTAQTGTSSGQAPNAGAEQPVERPEISNEAIASQGGVLTPKGVFSFEPTYQYQYSSNNQVLIQGLTIIPGITIGSSSVRALVDRMQTFTLGGRLGVTNRLEVEAEVPYVRRNDSTTVQPLSTSGSVISSNTKGNDLGDVQFGAHYQINQGSEDWPYFVGNLLVKSNTGKSPFAVPLDFNTGIPTQLPTGTGFWAIQPSLTAIYPSDPVVFFGNLRYIYNVGANVTLQPTVNTSPVAQTVNIKPGDGIGGSFGMGFGINDKASFSLAYEQVYFMSTSQNGGTIPGSSYDIGSFDLGFAYQATPRIGINLGVAIGITKASPDTAFTLRIPVKFQVY